MIDQELVDQYNRNYPEGHPGPMVVYEAGDIGEVRIGRCYGPALICTERPYNGAAVVRVTGKQYYVRLGDLCVVAPLTTVDLDLPHCPTHDRQFARDDGHCNECGANGYESELASGRWLDACADREQPGINWVICGGESGPGARPMHPDWARALRDQCAEAGVPFFMKQWGEHDERGVKVGKHAAGSLLDSGSHKAFP